MRPFLDNQTLLMGLAVSVFGVAFALVLWRSGKLSELRQALRQPAAPGAKKTPLPFQIFAGLFLVVWLTLVISAQARVSERRSRFHGHARNPAAKLEFSRDGKTAEVADPREVARFFALVEAADKPMAHHSHPVDLVRLRIGDTTYELGRDSKEPNEVWLSQVDPPATFGDPTLWRLRSPEFFAWFAAVCPAGQGRTEAGVK